MTTIVPELSQQLLIDLWWCWTIISLYSCLIQCQNWHIVSCNKIAPAGAQGRLCHHPVYKAFSAAVCHYLPFRSHTMIYQRKSKSVQSSWGKKQICCTSYSCSFFLTLLLKVVREQRKPLNANKALHQQQQHWFRGLSQQKNAKLSKMTDK